MFRIDRRLVKLTNKRSIKVKDEEKPEADTQEDEHPEAAASASDMAEELAQTAIEQYLSEAEKEIEERAAAAEKEAIEAGQKKADEIIENAEKEAVIIRKMAYEDGYKDGQKEFEGRLEEEREKDTAALTALLSEIGQERERINSEVEENTTALAIEIVRKIFKPAQEEIKDVFISLIKNAIRQMSVDGKFTIRVAPSEYERHFASGTGEIELENGMVVKATVLRDVALEEGDLIIDTEDMTVNAGLGTQLKYVELAFERANQYEPEG